MRDARPPDTGLRVLDELGAELQRAIERHQRSWWRRRRPRTALAVIAAVLLLGVPAAVIGAERWIFATDPPNLDELIERARTPQSLAPAGGTGTIEATVPDPGGGSPWAVLVFRSRTGSTCTRVGRRAAGKVGTPIARGGFRRYPVEEGTNCADLAEGSGVALNVSRVSDVPVTKRREPSRTILAGVAGPEIARVVVQGPRGPEELELSRRRAFLAVYRGALRRLPVSVTYRDGSTRVFR